MKDNLQTMLLESLESKIIYFSNFSKKVASVTEEVKKIKEPTQDTEHKKVDVFMYNTEVSYLFSELLILSALVLQLNLPLSETIKDFTETYKEALYKRKFSIEGEEIVEAEIGFLEKARKEYANSDFIKMITSQLEK